MAITSIDGVLNGALPPQPLMKVGAATTTGRWYSTFYLAGRPGAATVPVSGTAGSALTSYAGQIPFPSSVVGSNVYLVNMSVASTAIGTLFLCDRLWHNNGLSVTSTATQSVDSATFPSRDLNGTTNGEGVLIGMEITTVMGAGTPTWTIDYIDSNGNTSQVVTAAQPTTMAVNTFVPIQLGTGDTGVRKINNFKLSATHTSGAFSLVAYRIIARIDAPTANVGNTLDALQLGLPRMYDNSVPFLLWLPGSTTAPTIHANITYTQG